MAAAAVPRIHPLRLFSMRFLLFGRAMLALVQDKIFLPTVKVGTKLWSFLADHKGRHYIGFFCRP